jgi:hypothetical protein
MSLRYFLIGVGILCVLAAASYLLLFTAMYVVFSGVNN